MQPPTGRPLCPLKAKEPVFEDPSGLRERKVRSWGRSAALALSLWALAVLGAILYPDRSRQLETAAPQATLTEPGFRQGDADLLIGASAVAAPRAAPDLAATVDGRPVCRDDAPAAGAALAAPLSAPPLRVHALIPNDVESAFGPLLRNCARIDVILPEWFEIRGPDPAVERAEIDPEMEAALETVRAVRGGAVEVWPVVGLHPQMTAAEFLAAIGQKPGRDALVTGVLEAARRMGAQGVCLRLRDVTAQDAGALMPLLRDLRARTTPAGLGLCLVAGLSDQLWTRSEVVALVDRVIVPAYQEPWIGGQPLPLAPLDWLRRQMMALKADVPPEKLVVAVGGHAVDWVSGQPVPERISLAEAMARVAEAGAEVVFSSVARNSHAAFFDRDGWRHQIWMLDAASVYNAAQLMRELGLTDLAVASLGEEEPAYWAALDGHLSGPGPFSFGAPVFPDTVVYRGAGPFYRLAATGQAGSRLWRLDAEGRFIEGLRLDPLPIPARMERYGQRDARKIALTFDDGPDPVATARILDALKAEGAPATFFVVGQAALSAPKLVQRAVDEGHVIGSHSFAHPNLEELGAFRLQTDLSANRSLIEGIIGRTPLLFRPPYVRGPGPLGKGEALAFAVPRSDGHVVAGSDIVPTDWAGAPAEDIVRQAIKALEETGGNVIVLHDGRSTGMHTAEAVGPLVRELRARGYEIVPLPHLLGLTAADVMPPVSLPASLFKGVSVSVVTVVIGGLVALFWASVLASLARSGLYLCLSTRRDPVYPRRFGPLPGVTVVVPAFNEERVIAATVRAVLECDYPGIRCVVVDDGSTDATARVVEDSFGGDQRVRLLRQKNQGKWQALNLAFQSIDTEIAVCVDADTRISRDAITELVRPFTDRTVAAVAGTVVVGNADRLLTRFQAIEYITAQQIGRRAQDYLNGILVVPGALGAWRVEAVRDVGLYSAETLTEDADLTIWLRRGGFRVAYAEAARSETEAPVDTRSLLKQRLRWSLGNLQTLWKHRGAFAEFGLSRGFSMLDMVIFGYLIPVLSPLLDLLFLHYLAVLMMDWQAGQGLAAPSGAHLSVLAALVVQGMSLATAWVAHRRDGARVLPLLILVPLMNLLYRPLLYITVYRALWAAVSGRLAGWNKLRRRGLARKPGLSAP